jgi:phage terminase large subunit
MLEENGGWAAFITTPRGRNHAKAMYDHAKTNPKWFAEISSVHDTGALSPESLVETLAEYKALYGHDLGQAQFDQEYGCSFNAAILGAFYAREMHALRNEGRIVPMVALPGRPVHRAWDIGVRDDTSIWWFQVVGGRRLYPRLLYELRRGRGALCGGRRSAAREHGWLDGNDYMPHDAQGARMGLRPYPARIGIACGLSRSWCHWPARRTASRRRARRCRYACSIPAPKRSGWPRSSNTGANGTMKRSASRPMRSMTGHRI